MKFAPPQTDTKIQACLGLVGHYQHFIKAFACIMQPLHKHLSGEGASKKSKCVTLMEEVLGALEMLKNACFEAPVLSFADFKKSFLPLLPQKQTDDQYHPVAYTSQSLTIHKHNYHSTKQEFLILKWVIMKPFQEYLHWKPFIVKTYNNPLSYILTTPNLDATWHHWVECLTDFTFSIEYQMGLTMQPQMLWAELHWGWMQRLWSPSWTESPWDQQEEQMPMTQWWLTLMRRYLRESGKLPCNLELLIWVWTCMWLIGQPLNGKIQYLRAMINWILNWEVQDLNHLLRDDANTEEGMAVLQEWKKLGLYQGAIYHHIHWMMS